MWVEENTGLSTVQRRAILSIFTGMGTKLVFPPRSFIEIEDQTLDYVYIITEGYVQQYFIDHDGNTRTLFLLQEGDLCGEVSMLQQAYDMVITQAVNTVSVEKISQVIFFEELAKYPESYRYIFQMLTGKVRNLMAQIYENSFLDVKGAILNHLQRIAVRSGERTEYGMQVLPRLTHQDIANMVASTRSTVTRKLKELESDGALRRVGRDIFIKIEKQRP